MIAEKKPTVLVKNRCARLTMSVAHKMTQIILKPSVINGVVVVNLKRKPSKVAIWSTCGEILSKSRMPT